MEVKKDKKPHIRFLREMDKVLFDKKFAKKNPKAELYQVYRRIKKKKDLRYDITIMPPKMLGNEFVRTKGNRNSKGFQELYTVLQGKAIFLMQRTKGGIVEDVVAIRTKEREWVIVPPDYSVIMINPLNSEVLKTGNWVSEKTENIYKELEKMEGACYFYTKSGWIKNDNYKNVPPLRFEQPLKKRPKDLDFLSKGANK